MRDYDKFIYESIVYRDEYGLVGTRFAPSDVIVDIGAHIGIFSYLCYLRGARYIWGYEVDAENYRFLENNLGDLPGCHIHHSAVVRSDLTTDYSLATSGYVRDNTGSCNVITGGLVYDPVTQKIIGNKTPGIQKVGVIPLDRILAGFKKVKLLKIDCEGSEFPILLTSKMLHKVERIVGEYHEIDAKTYQKLTPWAKVAGCRDYIVERLMNHLQRADFIHAWIQAGPTEFLKRPKLRSKRR